MTSTLSSEKKFFPLHSQMLHAKHINHIHLQSNFSLKMYMHTYPKNYRRVLKTMKGTLLPYLSDKTLTL